MTVTAFCEPFQLDDFSTMVRNNELTRVSQRPSKKITFSMTFLSQALIQRSYLMQHISDSISHGLQELVHEMQRMDAKASD